MRTVALHDDLEETSDKTEGIRCSQYRMADTKHKRYLASCDSICCPKMSISSPTKKKTFEFVKIHVSWSRDTPTRSCGAQDGGKYDAGHLALHDRNLVRR